MKLKDQVTVSALPLAHSYCTVCASQANCAIKLQCRSKFQALKAASCSPTTLYNGEVELCSGQLKSFAPVKAKEFPPEPFLFVFSFQNISSYLLHSALYQ